MILKKGKTKIWSECGLTEGGWLFWGQTQSSCYDELHLFVALALCRINKVSPLKSGLLESPNSATPLGTKAIKFLHDCGHYFCF